MQLGQQKRKLLGIKSSMEREYGRIAARYLRIFTSINKDLEQRIRQVDQPVFELVQKNMVTNSNRMNSLTAWVTTSQNEGLNQSQQILMSKMKKNAEIALEQSTDFLSQISEQRVLTRKILISNPEGNEDKICQIPVAICETINSSAGMVRTDISTPDGLTSSYINQINDKIRESKNLPWHQSEKSQLVSEEFNRLLNSSEKPSRVKEMINKLYSSSDFETL
jgi:hypothetical protein